MRNFDDPVPSKTYLSGPLPRRTNPQVVQDDPSQKDVISELAASGAGSPHAFFIVATLLSPHCRRYKPSVSQDLVMVSVTALAEAFFRGLDRFIIELFGDPAREPLARRRLQKLVHALPYEPTKNTSAQHRAAVDCERDPTVDHEK